MRYHGDRWVTDDFCCHRHRYQKSKRLHDDAIRHRGDAYSKKRCFCAVSALFPNRLSPSRKSKLLIASMLSTGGDSDRCFATFFYLYQGNSTAPIKPRFSHQKTAFYNQKTAFLQPENGVFLTIKCKGKRVRLLQ